METPPNQALQVHRHEDSHEDSHKGSQELSQGRSHKRTGWQSLHAEIRLMIYAFTWEPRLVIVKGCSEVSQPNPEEHDQDNEPSLYKARSAPLVALQINSESRHETLKHYTPFIQNAEHTMYINPAIDTLRLELSGSLADLSFQQRCTFLERFYWDSGRAIFRHPGWLPAYIRMLSVEDPDATQVVRPLTVDFWEVRALGRAHLKILWLRYCRLPGCKLKQRWRWQHTTYPESVIPAMCWHHFSICPLNLSPGRNTRTFPFMACEEIPGHQSTGYGPPYGPECFANNE